jgi:uncharacterized protein YggU (UPF0235/DUF167 family)
MSNREYRLHDGKKGAALAIRITPRASKNEVAEIQRDGTVRIRLTASSNDEQANAALLEFLADVLDISASQMEVIAGTAGRDKLVSIIDLDAETVHQRILKRLS